MTRESLHCAAARCLQACHPDDKLALGAQIQNLWQSGQLAFAHKEESISKDLPPAETGLLNPGRPAKPILVHPRELSKRSLHTLDGRIALIHAITHIEFNAVNLAWDAIYRFRGLPHAYYADWLKVAREESLHFQLLRDRLRELGSDYGELPAHDGLWDMARRTAHDVLVRMALVPRVLEARGLDVTPGMIKKLSHYQDTETVAILERILEDEIGHVAIGSHWYKVFCVARGHVFDSLFRQLLAEYFQGNLRGPFNYRDRLQAGFSAAELDALAAE